MSETPFSLSNNEFTQQCHTLAQRAIYPELFGVKFENLTFDDQTIRGNGSEQARFFDGELGIDQRVWVRYQGLQAPIPYTVQERFQRPTHAARRNITITEWNPNSNTPSELYKCHAHLFACGFIDIEQQHIIEVVVCPVAAMMDAIGHKRLAWDMKTNPRTQQPFVRIEIDELNRAGLVQLHIQDKSFLPAKTPKKGRRIHDLNELVELWPAVLVRFKKKIGITSVAYLADASPVALNDTDAVLQFSKEFHYAKACDAARRLPFEQVLNECLASPHRLVFRAPETYNDSPIETRRTETPNPNHIFDYAQTVFAGTVMGRSGIETPQPTGATTP